jgi:hypothetical protein
MKTVAKNLMSLSLIALFALPAVALPSAWAGADSVVGTVTQTVGVGGEQLNCSCSGAGRTASCDGPNCTCDYDWQGYPRCTAGGKFLLV